MSFLSIASGPIVGAVIGYITNYIAIKMLFRPLEPKYIFGIQLPFTPGIVPRRKNQLAKTLGDAIVAKFFNADDLELVFTSDVFADAVAGQLTELLCSETKLAAITKAIPESGIEASTDELCVRMLAGLYTSELPAALAEKGASQLLASLRQTSIGKALGEGAAPILKSKTEDMIREMIADDSFAYVRPVVQAELERLSDTPIGKITAVLESDKSVIREKMKGLYMDFMRRNVRPIVESIDVGGMITDKIILMTAGEVEGLVLDVVSRELKLVVWFGALVGAIIGTVNIFI